MGSKIDQQIEQDRIMADRVERSGRREATNVMWMRLNSKPMPEGFRAKHVDGDWANNEIENLILIEDSKGLILEEDRGPGERRHMKMHQNKPTVSDEDLKKGIAQSEMRANWIIKGGKKLEPGEELEQIDKSNRRDIRFANLRIKKASQ